MHSDDDLASAHVFDFVQLYLRDVENGAPLELEDYLERFPGHEEAISHEYYALREQGTREVRAESFGRYELVRQIGQGGQGTVYLARDTTLGREVALKVLPNRFVSEDRRRRFRREAEIVARLHHPGLCEVLDAELDGDTPFLAMRYVEGVTLDEAAGEPLVLVERAARALHAAHEAGVVHRDVKPGNILVTPDGDPVVLDFGLAREVEDETLTEPGTALGTLAYMAPEQLGEGSVDRRTDVYALGITLYELVTGERPFRARTRDALALQIRQDEIPDARTKDRSIPTDVAIVLQKALEKNPDRRYASALEFAEDLRRIREFEPILARPPGRFTKLTRWARRHPVLSVSTALLAISLTAGLVVALLLLARVREESERYRVLALATYARVQVDKAPTFALLTALEAAHLRRNATVNTALYEALAACREVRAVVASGRAQKQATIAAETERVAFVKNDGTCRVQTLDGRERFEIECPAPIRHASFDPAGERLAVVCKDGRGFLYDAANGEPITELPRHRGSANYVVFSNDGRRLVTCSGDGTSRVLDVEQRRAFGPFGDAKSPHFRARIAGDRLFACDAAGDLYAYDLASGEEIWSIRDPGPIRMLTVDDDGRHLAFATYSKMRVVACADGQELVRHDGVRDDLIHAMDFDNDGKRLAVGSLGVFRVWSVGSGEVQLEKQTHNRRVLWGANFSPDGTRLATAAMDGTARVFDLATGDELAVFSTFVKHVLDVQWTADGQHIMTMADRRAASLYRLGDSPGLVVLRAHEGEVRRARFSPDGTKVLTAGEDGTARVYDFDGRERATFRVGAPLLDARWSDDGRRVLTHSTHGARVFALSDPSDGMRLGRRPVVAALWCDDERAVTVIRDRGVALWNASTGERLRATRIPHRIRCATLLAGGTSVAVGHELPGVSVVPLDGGTPDTIELPTMRESIPKPTVLNLSPRPQHEQLFVAMQDTHVRLLDLHPLRIRDSRSGTTPGFTTVDESGRRLLIGGAFTSRLEHWQLEGNDFGPHKTVAEHDDKLTQGAFSPDGSMFVTASFDQTIRAYRWKDAEGYAVLHGHQAQVLHVEFSPDGRWILSASADGTARIWPTDPYDVAMQRKPRELTSSERAMLAGKSSRQFNR